MNILKNILFIVINIILLILYGGFIVFVSIPWPFVRMYYRNGMPYSDWKLYADEWLLDKI